MSKRDGLDWLSSETDGESMTPCQFAEVYGESVYELTPEQRLAKAVLEQAIDDLRLTNRVSKTGYIAGVCSGGWKGKKNQQYEHHRDKLLQETIAWFESDDASWATAFVSVCNVLPNCDADSIRRLLRSCNWNPVHYREMREGNYQKRANVNPNWTKRRDSRTWADRHGDAA